MTVLPVERAGDTPDPDLLKKDPMAEMFGPGSSVKMISDANSDQIPDEVRAVLDQYGLSGKSFQCMLKELPEGSTAGDQTSSTNTAFIKGWTSSVPSTQWIAHNYGPGTYILYFTWRNKDLSTDGKSVPMHEEVTVVISEKFRDEFKQYRLKTKIRQAGEMKTDVRDTLIENRIEGDLLGSLGAPQGPAVDPKTAAKAYISETIETAKMLGLQQFQQAPPPRVIEWDKVLPAMIAGAAALLKIFADSAAARKADSDKLMMLLLDSGRQSSTQMIELFKAQSGVGSGNMAIKEFKDMVLGALDIKDALAGDKHEGLADKVFRIIEGVMPQILTIAATTAEARAAQRNPMVQAAKTYIDKNPDFQALKGNPAEMKKAIEKMDEFYGWEQTDTILTIAGWERPADCIRDPNKRTPPGEEQGISPEQVQEQPDNSERDE